MRLFKDTRASIDKHFFLLGLIFVLVIAIALGRSFGRIASVIGAGILGVLYGKYYEQKGPQVFMIMIALVFIIGYSAGSPLSLPIVAFLSISGAIIGTYLAKKGVL